MYMLITGRDFAEQGFSGLANNIVVSYSHRREWQLPGFLFGIKILFLFKVIKFLNRENTYNYNYMF